MLSSQLDQFNIRFSIRVVTFQESSDEGKGVLRVVWPSLNQRCEHLKAMLDGSRGYEVFLKAFPASADLLERVHGAFMADRQRCGIQASCPLSYTYAEKPSGLGRCRSSASGLGSSPPWARWIPRA